jgi:hypothetical protein
MGWVDIGFTTIPRHKASLAVQIQDNPRKCNVGVWLTSQALAKSYSVCFQCPGNKPIIAIHINAIFSTCRARLFYESSYSPNTYFSAIARRDFAEISPRLKARRERPVLEINRFNSPTIKSDS